MYKLLSTLDKNALTQHKFNIYFKQYLYFDIRSTLNDGNIFTYKINTAKLSQKKKLIRYAPACLR